jgi:tetratricopeptide (TPR) repeat protein/transglutaminase-like putative cysteine protease
MLTVGREFKPAGKVAMSTLLSARLLLLLCVVGSVSAWRCAAAQVAGSPKNDPSQEAVVFDRFDNLVRYEDDGTGIRETTAVIRVQSQAGVQALGQLVIGYSSATEKLEVDYVRVRKPDGQVVDTPLANSQDFAPEVLRQAPTYTDFRQRHVSVANLQAGDTLEYHTVTHVTTPLAPHQFWYEHSFLKRVAVHEEKLEINVPKSRDLKPKSPDRKWETSDSGDRRIYTWTIRDFYPDRKHQPATEQSEPDYTPDVQISTFLDWQQVSHWYASLQGERAVVNENVRSKAAELTSGATTPLEKTRRLYDYVARKVRYVSLSFGVGRLQPHTASEVLQNGFGDCKDKHTLLQALLRAEGIQSYPVLISSYRELDPEIPSPAQFNHEITAVELGGVLTWLDTTAEVAPYGLIMYQLRDKQALLAADGKIGGLHRTPANSPVKNSLSIKLDGKFTQTGAFDSGVEIVAQGDSDIPLRAAFRSLPQTQWTDILTQLSALWGLAGEVSDIHLDSVEDTSKPFHLVYHYHKDNYFSVPNSGVGFRILPPMQVRHVQQFDPRKPAKPLNVGPAGEQVYEAHVQFPSNYTIQLAPTAAMSRDYGDYSVSYDLNKNILEAKRKVVLKVNELPASRRNDYESFENTTGNEVQQVLTATITPASSIAMVEAANVTGTAEELHKAGISAMQRQDLNGAADLLKHSLDADPNQKDAWDDLGRTYASLGEHDAAIQAFRKQIELDAFHKSANQDLAGELQKTGKFDEAIAAYRRQLEITPFSKLAHKNVGLLLSEHNQDAEAIKELGAAASLPPDDPELKLALSRLYAKSGETTKSEALLKSVTGASSGSGDDIYASALRDDLDPNQTWREARKTLDDIGDQFDAGEFDHPDASAFHAMDLVALAWARTGWAKFLQRDYLEALAFLQSSWLLSQSGTVENRVARVLEKEGQAQGARQALALACAAGGADAVQSRDRLAKLAGADADKLIADATAELVKMRTINFAGVSLPGASARFALTFEGSSKPQRVEWLEGSPEMHKIADIIRDKEYPVRFPDVSSVKIVRRASVTCETAECTLVLQPLEGLQGGAHLATGAPAK